MFDAFISYHSGDAEWVGKLRDALVEHHVRVWLDRDQLLPGGLFVTALEGAIERVGCVVLVVSTGAMKSGWVQEEYSRALDKSASAPKSAPFKLVPVLIDDAEPTGFLKNRNWIDFRDAERFDERLVVLVAAIRGISVAGGGADASDEARSDPHAATRGVDEVTVVHRRIARVEEHVRSLKRTRLLAVLPGLVIGVVGVFVVEGMSLPMCAGVLLAAPSITALIAFGATARRLDRLEARLEQYEVLRDGLEACRARTAPGCARIRARFWTMMDQLTEELGAEPGGRA